MWENLEAIKQRNEMLKNNKKYLKEIYTSIKKVLPDSHVYLFGSILKDQLVGGSDIDILIIADVPKKHMKRAELIVEIEKDASLPYIHPFEFHLITQAEFNEWNSIYNLETKNLKSYLES